MALYYENLYDDVRSYMAAEVDFEITRSHLYISPRLNKNGIKHYPGLLKEAVLRYNDSWLSGQLVLQNCLKVSERRKKKNGGYIDVKVPVTAGEILAEGEFNRFYVRGLCQLAVDHNISFVEVYRGKETGVHRPESDRMIGRQLSARVLLDDLRNSPGVDPALGLPSGPASGLTVRLIPKG